MLAAKTCKDSLLFIISSLFISQLKSLIPQVNHDNDNDNDKDTI